MSSIQEAAKLLHDCLTDPWVADKEVPGFSEVDWQKVYTAMREDYEENMKAGDHEDWPSVIIAALDVISGNSED